MERVVILIILRYAASRTFCISKVTPLEVGVWRHDLYHMDSAIVENRPVTLNEGQIYVYENYFPNRTIKYIHVDNLARRSCGASASIKAGGVGTSSVLIVLHSDKNQEIRSVIDIWGTKNTSFTKPPKPGVHAEEMSSLKSMYLFKDLRTVNHNYHKNQYSDY